MTLLRAEIPNGEILYRYAKPNLFPIGQEDIPAAVFNDAELSCDWAKFQASPECTFHFREGRTVIIEIEICDEIKNPSNPKNSDKLEVAWKQEVVHDPRKKEDDPVHGENHSHSLIIGSKKKGVTVAIKKKSKIRSLDVLKKFWESTRLSP